MDYELSARQTLIIAILVLFLGKYLNSKLGFLRRYNIPEPVTGGVLASLVFSLLYLVQDVAVSFNLADRDTFLIVFFTCIGLSSRISSLISGGPALLILLLLAVAGLFLQNLTGIAVALSSSGNPVIGILGGSISLSGGHGTAIAWSPLLAEDYGLHNAMEIGIACATFGLVLGGIIGGPIAGFLINRYRLTSTSNATLVVGVPEKDGVPERISVDSALNALLVISVAIGIGTSLHEWLEHVGIKLPTFVTCLFAGILMTNTLPLIFKTMPWPTGTPVLALISDLSLGLFLSMSLMSLQLWTLLELAGPITLLLAAQVVLVTLFSVFVLFPLLGRSYDAAVIASGYAGLALGATPTAIANMTAVTERFGASPKAFLIVPLVGAFFIDIANAIVVNTMLRLVSG